MSNSILPQNASNEPITRRRFLSALPALGALPLVPHIVGLEGVTPQDFDTVEPPIVDPETLTEVSAGAEAILERLGNLCLILILYIFHTHHYLSGHRPIPGPTELVEKFSKATDAALDIADILLSAEFIGKVLKPLLGSDYHRFLVALNQGAEKAQTQQDLAALFIEQAPQFDPETLQKETIRAAVDLTVLGTDAAQYGKGEITLEKFTERVKSIEPDAIALLMGRVAETRQAGNENS